jgi:hypothetical protein
MAVEEVKKGKIKHSNQTVAKVEIWVVHKSRAFTAIK